VANNGTVHWNTAFLNQMRQKYNLPAAPKKGAQNPLALPPPPVGTYDPSLDYNAQASSQGLLQLQNDAQTQYDQGTEDFGQALKNLATQRDRTLADLNTQIGDVHRQYGILGHQQADAAASHGITSQGLLALSAQKRSANETHDIAPLTLAEQRANQDYATQDQALNTQYARAFGGFNGNVLTGADGKPIFGTLATQVARGGGADALYQQGIGNQRAYQAQQNGYIYTPPRPTRKQARKVGAYIGSH